MIDLWSPYPVPTWEWALLEILASLGAVSFFAVIYLLLKYRKHEVIQKKIVKVLEMIDEEKEREKLSKDSTSF